MEDVMKRLVQAACPGFPMDRTVKQTRDVVSWYKILAAQRCLLVPPINVLKANMMELDRFAEAVRSFAVCNIHDSLYDWDNLDLYEANTPMEILKMVNHVHQISAGHMVACDIETRRVEWEDNTLLSIGFATDESTCYAIYNIPIEGARYEGPGVAPDLYCAIHSALQNLFDDTTVTFCWHNGKFDCGRLKYLCNLSARIDEDTMLLHYVGINEKRGTHGLKELGQLYLQAPAWDDELDKIKRDWCKKNKVKLADFMYDSIPTSTLIPYMQRDCIATYRLLELFKRLQRENSKFIYEQLIRASNTYMQIELNGIRLDLEYLEDLEYDLEKQIEKDNARLQEVAGRIWNPMLYSKMTGAKVKPDTPFNYGSPKQLKWMLQEVLGYPVASTDATTMEHLLEQVENGTIQNPDAKDFIESVGAVRKNSKYMDTYVQGLRDVVCRDSRIRCTFNLHGTETGRLSSTGPNMQNIPRNKMIKNLIVATPGYKLLQLDYSQAELRVLAMISEDPYMIKSYQEGRDFHDAVAETMFGPDFTKEQRVLAKTINFGIAYGRGPGSIAEKFGKTMAESRQIIDQWFEPMPKVREYINNRRKMPSRGEPCVTLLGRERHFVITNEELNHIQNEYINTPIQSLASDFTMLSLLDIHDFIQSNGLDARIVSTVHDSIIIEVRDDPVLLKQVADACLGILATTPKKYVPNCQVPFKADAEAGYRWGDLKELEEWI